MDVLIVRARASGDKYLQFLMWILSGRFGFPDNYSLGYQHVRVLLLGFFYCHGERLGKKSFIFQVK